MRGADLLVQTLQNAGVSTLFSLSGNQIMPVYDACIDAGLRIVHTRHEGAAVYMADAWSQVTGEVGVALVAGGPGFANSMSPLFSAHHAESAVLLLSGDSPLSEDGLGPFQELDQTGVTRPLVKLARRAAHADTIGDDVMHLIDVALDGRPGPVHLALPFDVLENQAQPAPSSNSEKAKDQHVDNSDLVALLNRAKRPIILTGPRCNDSRAHVALTRLRQTLNIPVVPMESPRGLKDPTLGTLSNIMADADLIILIGKKLDFTLAFGRAPTLPADAQIAVIDPDSDAIVHAKKQLGQRLVYQSQQTSTAAIDALIAAAPSRHPGDWKEHVRQAIANRNIIADVPEVSNKLLPQEVCERVQALIERVDEAILVCDGGEFGQWAQAICHAPTRIINGVSGAIGGGLPYAIAAKIARPNATVILLMGDGTAGFHLAEFDTSVRENAPIIAIIGNDSKWNAEHLIQVHNYGSDRTIGCTLNPDARYEDAAQALGGKGFSVSSRDELDQALDGAEASQHTICINAHIHGLPAPTYR